MKRGEERERKGKRERESMSREIESRRKNERMGENCKNCG